MSGTQTPEFDLHSLSQYSLFSVSGEDPASILTSYLTFVGLLVTAAFLSGVQLIGEPIECWCPAQTTDAMCNYTKSVCWISKQYVIDHEDAIPSDPLSRGAVLRREMQFYPMVPFILLVIAVALKLPNFFWTAFQGEEGLNINKATRLANDNNLEDEKSGEQIAFVMNFSLVRSGTRNAASSRMRSVKRVVTALALFPAGDDLGTYQTGLFLLTRLMTVVITVAVFPGIGYALQMDFITWGWALFGWVVLDHPQPDMAVFPRETLCDFWVRQMQNVQAYTVQCVLPINMWNEKVFITLWFWLVFLVLANVYSYQYWFRKLILPHNRHALITKHLTIVKPATGKLHRKQINDFVWNHLTHDTVLVLRILEMSAGNQFANGVVFHLWKMYSQHLLSGPVDVNDGLFEADDLIND